MLGSNEVLHNGKTDENECENDDKEIILIKSGSAKSHRSAEALGGRVLEDGLYDLTECESYYRKVVALKTKRGKTNYKAKHRCRKGAKYYGDEQIDDAVTDKALSHNSRCLTANVCADAHKSRVTEGKLTEEANHESERNREEYRNTHLLKKVEG